MNVIFFDMDGTLFDTEVYYQKTWTQAAREFGYELTWEQSMAVRSLGRPFLGEQFLEWFGPDVNWQAISQRRRELMDVILKKEGIPLKPGVRETLQTLRERGWQNAVVTSTNMARAKQNLEESGIYDLFDDVVSGSMVERGKPAPDIYLYACERLAVKPEETYAVEDSPNGVRSAAAAGCKTIMIPDLTQPAKEICALLYQKADSLEQLPDIFR